MPARPAGGDADASTHNPDAGVVDGPAPTAAQLQEKVCQINTLFQLSTLLSAQRDLQQLLDTAARRAVARPPISYHARSRRFPNIIS